MGQQQLLLLVLSTVIVGLATVAGIQAFSEGQTQATQDALTQRGISIGQDIAAELGRPNQLGGISSSSSPSQVAAAVGLDDQDGSGHGIPADGAGNDADCDITDASSTPFTIICSENGSGSENSSDDTPSPQTVTVEVDENGASVTTINGTSLSTL
ncbi:MAG: hypothetical protein BRD25_01310 [Bacteroidetes bacterium QH_1_61_8]|nr:MAG: hypothetical protein BRD25_01310 [Bacteroidetes bacterium QH_1_61_8]